MQKPFYFLAICLLFSACSFNPPIQGRGEDYIQGEWQQDSIPMQKKLLSYSLYNFKFSCDSFYVKVNSFSKVNSGADTCMNAGHWTEYIRGNIQAK